MCARRARPDAASGTVAISDVFEVKPPGTEEKLPKGWEKGFNEAAYNATLNGGSSGAKREAVMLGTPLLAVFLGVVAGALVL